MERFNAYEIKSVYEWTNDEGMVHYEAQESDAEKMAEAHEAPKTPTRIYWTLSGLVGADSQPIADFESEADALELLYMLTGIEGKPGIATYLAPIVEQGKFIPGCTDAICGIIVSDDDLIEATLREDESGNATGITRQLARRYLAEYGRDVANAYQTSWREMLENVESLYHFAEEHRTIIAP